MDELKDVLAMLNWMNFNRGRFGFDLDRCYVMGTSYGALMATWFSLLCNSRRINNAMGIKAPWTTIKGIGLISGMTDTHRNAASAANSLAMAASMVYFSPACFLAAAE